MSCFKDHVYPFTAIVGQEKMKKALILNAVNPRIGGVLIRGEKGTAKSTIARALAELLPEIEVVDGCRYSCDPGDLEKMCADCTDRMERGEEMRGSRRKMRVVDLPINATQDRVAGTIDIEHAIKKGEKKFEPGILADANRGILYVDEVNLLGDHIVDILLDSAAMGVNLVEREGVSYSHPAHFMLIGTMNPEEGEIRPQLLDRFGLCVDVKGIKELSQRVDVARRHIDYEKDPHAFCEQWEAEQKKLAGRIARSIELLSQVDVSDGILETIGRISIDLGVDGHRADIVMVETAMTIAAYNGRGEVIEGDVREAAELVYSHRMRKKPFEESGSDDNIRDAVENNIKENDGGPPESRQPSPDNAPLPETTFRIGHTMGIEPVTPIKDRVLRNNAGKRTKTLTDSASGVYVRSDDLKEGETDIALDASIRAAAPYQQCREKGAVTIFLRRSDLKKKVREKKVGSTILFVVDASGSMGARQRMEAAKGAVMSLLIDAYQHRDKVGMVAFRGERPEILLTPTSSVELAKKSLEQLPTGGMTPLSQGLILGADMLKRELRADPGTIPVLVLVTDGKANVPMNGGEPVEEAIETARKLADDHILTLVLDTEDDFVNLGLAKSIAEASKASYYKIGEISADGITGLVKKAVS